MSWCTNPGCPAFREDNRVHLSKVLVANIDDFPRLNGLDVFLAMDTEKQCYRRSIKHGLAYPRNISSEYLEVVGYPCALSAMSVSTQRDPTDFDDFFDELDDHSKHLHPYQHAKSRWKRSDGVDACLRYSSWQSSTYIHKLNLEEPLSSCQCRLMNYRHVKSAMVATSWLARIIWPTKMREHCFVTQTNNYVRTCTGVQCKHGTQVYSASKSTFQITKSGMRVLVTLLCSHASLEPA
jgi:hypothetical protein